MYFIRLKISICMCIMILPWQIPGYMSVIITMINVLFLSLGEMK